MSQRQLRGHQRERYEVERSPLAQKPTQKQFAALLKVKKGQLHGLIAHKEDYVVRRAQPSGGKVRQLAYPKGKLRAVHEILKYHLGKVSQPEYIFSPRKGYSTRDYAEFHAGQIQYLTLDLKQFYPSTSREHVYRWLRHKLGMLDDVAGLCCRLVTIDDRVSFGSPLTPVLTTLVHRDMFDAMAEECRRRGLRFSIWVDDITISGAFVPGRLVAALREIVRSNGLRSHKIQFRVGARPVVLTGVPLRVGRVDAPRSVHDRIHAGYANLPQPDDPAYRRHADRLLSALGSYRFYVGSKTRAGRRAADRMNALRQRRNKVPVRAVTLAEEPPMVSNAPDHESPF